MTITALVSIEMRPNAFPPVNLLLIRVITLSVVPESDAKILVTGTSINSFVGAGLFEGRRCWQDSIEVIIVRFMLSWFEMHDLWFEYILIINYLSFQIIAALAMLIKIIRSALSMDIYI